jgi:hypothetical protein
MASLIHQDGRYYAQFYDSDRSPSRTRVALRTSEKRTAQRILARAEDKWALGDYDPRRHGRQHGLFGWEPGPDEDLSTLGKAIDAYLESSSHLRPDTQRTYREVLRLFEDHVGSDQHVDVSKPAISPTGLMKEFPVTPWLMLRGESTSSTSGTSSATLSRRARWRKTSPKR